MKICLMKNRRGKIVHTHKFTFLHKSNFKNKPCNMAHHKVYHFNENSNELCSTYIFFIIEVLNTFVS